MPSYGYFLSSEELNPTAMLRAAQQAETVGIDKVLVSDHFHPWLESQGESPFIWSVIGGIASTTHHHITTGVTCPTVRVHPAILAQAAATTQLLAEGRFRFGVGSGENLNEHILGHRWPPAATRLKMLEEAIEVIRSLWQGGYTTHHGEFYTVENARIFSLPSEPPPIYVSGFGPDSTSLAARLGNGYVNVAPDRAAVDFTAKPAVWVPPWAPSRSVTAPTSQRHANSRTTVGAPRDSLDSWPKNWRCRRISIRRPSS